MGQKSPIRERHSLEKELRTFIYLSITSFPLWFCEQSLFIHILHSRWGGGQSCFWRVHKTLGSICNLTMNPVKSFSASVYMSANKSIYFYTFCLTCSRETCQGGDRKAWEVFLHFRLTFGHSQVTSTITSYDDDEYELVWYAWETCKLWYICRLFCLLFFFFCTLLTEKVEQGEGHVCSDTAHLCFDMPPLCKRMHLRVGLWVGFW